MVIRRKKQKQCSTREERNRGDCWIGLSLARSSGLILTACVGKHTDVFIEQLVVNTEGKTDCKQLNTDEWGGYERVLPPEIKHYIGKDQTQRLERRMEHYDNKREDGIDDRISLQRSGNRPK